MDFPCNHVYELLFFESPKRVVFSGMSYANQTHESNIFAKLFGAFINKK